MTEESKIDFILYKVKFEPFRFKQSRWNKFKNWILRRKPVTLKINYTDKPLLTLPEGYSVEPIGRLSNPKPVWRYCSDLDVHYKHNWYSPDGLVYYFCPGEYYHV